MVSSPLPLAGQVSLTGSARCGAVHTADPLLNYVQDLIGHPIAAGSCRGLLAPRIALLRAAKAQALISGRDYVAPTTCRPCCRNHSPTAWCPWATPGAALSSEVRAMVEAVPLA